MNRMAINLARLRSVPLLLILLLAASALLALSGCAPPSAPPTPPAKGAIIVNGKDVVTVTPSSATAAHILVSFKLDPRLTGSTYGGERWVSPPTYTGATAQDTVEVKAFSLDAQGQATPISAEWTSADPEMVSVSPTQGEQVKITVHRAGESTLQVTSNGMSKTLTIKAANPNNIMQVEITQ